MWKSMFYLDVSTLFKVKHNLYRSKSVAEMFMTKSNIHTLDPKHLVLWATSGSAKMSRDQYVHTAIV